MRNQLITIQQAWKNLPTHDPPAATQKAARHTGTEIKYRQNKKKLVTTATRLDLAALQQTIKHSPPEPLSLPHFPSIVITIRTS